MNKIDVDPRDAFILVEPPLTSGPHKSKLVEILRKEQGDGKLDFEESVRSVTWIDSNVPSCSTYEGGTQEGKRNLKCKGTPELRPDQRPEVAGRMGRTVHHPLADGNGHVPDRHHTFRAAAQDRGPSAIC